jgi:hypothetical protein
MSIQKRKVHLLRLIQVIEQRIAEVFKRWLARPIL